MTRKSVALFFWPGRFLLSSPHGNLEPGPPSTGPLVYLVWAGCAGGPWSIAQPHFLPFENHALQSAPCLGSWGGELGGHACHSPVRSQGQGSEQLYNLQGDFFHGPRRCQLSSGSPAGRGALSGLAVPGAGQRCHDLEPLSIVQIPSGGWGLATR